MSSPPLRVAIYGIGTYLPELVRENSAWSESVLERWRGEASRVSVGDPESYEFEGEELIRKALSKGAEDPFHGGVERRYMPEGMNVVDMEESASKKALRASGVDSSKIDFVILQATPAALLATNNACTIHERLGLPERCLSLEIEGVCNGFQQQMTLAQALIQSGQGKWGLLVQSCGTSPVKPKDQPIEALAGDGASAVVVGPSDGENGLLSTAHFTDGSVQGGLVVGVPGGQWWDEGKAVFHTQSAFQIHAMFMSLVNCAKTSVGAALEAAGLRAEDIDFYASHQPFSWFRPITQSVTGLEHARTVDTFFRTGNLSAANLPFVLAEAQERKLLKAGDLIATHAGGSGQTFASMILRWGT